MLREFGRRMIADSLNANSDYDGFCFRHGGPPPPSSGLRRPQCKTLGRGAGKQIPFADGSGGSWNAMDVIWELKADGNLDALDFTEPTRIHWVLNIIPEFIGAIDDREILSFLVEGVR